MAPGGNSIQGSGSSNAGAVATGVIVTLLVVGAATAITIVLVVLFLRRRWQQKNSEAHSMDGFDNQLYNRQMASGSVNGKNVTLPTGGNRDSVPGDYAAIPEDEAHYEDMNVSYLKFPNLKELAVAMGLNVCHSIILAPFFFFAFRVIRHI